MHINLGRCFKNKIAGKFDLQKITHSIKTEKFDKNFLSKCFTSEKVDTFATAERKPVA